MNILEVIKMKYKAVQGKILIAPKKEIKVTRTITEPDDEKNRGKSPTEIMEVKETKRKVKANFQIGVVVAAPSTSAYAVGDTIVYRPGIFVDFDLIKNTKIGDEYAVIGWWNESDE